MNNKFCGIGDVVEFCNIGRCGELYRPWGYKYGNKWGGCIGGPTDIFGEGYDDAEDLGLPGAGLNAEFPQLLSEQLESLPSLSPSSTCSVSL